MSKKNISYRFFFAFQRALGLLIRDSSFFRLMAKKFGMTISFWSGREAMAIRFTNRHCFSCNFISSLSFRAIARNLP